MTTHHTQAHLSTTNTIAIVLSTYNGAKYIGAQLDALRAQTYSDWRCYIRDDGSKDNTISILQQYAALDARIVFLDDKKGNMGLNASHYYLLAIPSEDYIATCDQDDVWHDNKLAVSIAKLKSIETQRKAPALVHTDSIVVDSNLNVLQAQFIGKRGLSEDLNGILFANSVQGGSILMNKSLRDICLLAPPVLPYDYHVGLIANLTGVRGFVAETLLQYRQHSASSIATSVGKQQFSSNTHVSASLRLSLSGYHHIKHDFDHIPVSHQAQAALVDYFYLFEGNNRLKKCWILLKKKYPFYRRKDFAAFLFLLIKNENLRKLIAH